MASLRFFVSLCSFFLAFSSHSWLIMGQKTAIAARLERWALLKRDDSICLSFKLSNHHTVDLFSLHEVVNDFKTFGKQQKHRSIVHLRAEVQISRSLCSVSMRAFDWYHGPAKWKWSLNTLTGYVYLNSIGRKRMTKCKIKQRKA